MKQVNQNDHRKLIKGVTIASCIILGIILIFLLAMPLISSLLLYINGFYNNVLTNPALWLNILIFLIIAASAAIILILILPFLVFFFKKIYSYISLFFICLFKGYKFNILRLPFSSVKGLSSKGDISIKTKEGRIYLHFLDIVKPHKRALTIPNNTEYVITPVYGKSTSKFSVVRGEVQKYGQSGNEGVGHKFGVLMSSGHILAKNRDRVKQIPIQSGNSDTHMIISQSMPVEFNIIRNGEILSVDNGQQIGNYTFYTLKFLKKGLKNKLHFSIFK